MAKTVDTKYLSFSGRHATTRQQTTLRGIPQGAERLPNVWQLYKLVIRLELRHQEHKLLESCSHRHHPQTRTHCLLTETVFYVRVHEIVALIEPDTIVKMGDIR